MSIHEIHMKALEQVYVAVALGSAEIIRVDHQELNGPTPIAVFTIRRQGMTTTHQEIEARRATLKPQAEVRRLAEEAFERLYDAMAVSLSPHERFELAERMTTKLSDRMIAAEAQLGKQRT